MQWLTLHCLDYGTVITFLFPEKGPFALISEKLLFWYFPLTFDLLAANLLLRFSYLDTNQIVLWNSRINVRILSSFKAIKKQPTEVALMTANEYFMA